MVDAPSAAGALSLPIVSPHRVIYERTWAFTGKPSSIAWLMLVAHKYLDFTFTPKQLTTEEVSRFSALLNALSLGAPPHAGFALGVDRFLSILVGSQSIRDVIAFPKTAAGADLLFGSPAELSRVADAGASTDADGVAKERERKRKDKDEEEAVLREYALGRAR